VVKIKRIVKSVSREALALQRAYTINYGKPN
jgi:hypothetical protein